MNRQSRIRTTPERRGRTSRCKAFTKVWSCMGWKASIMSARAKNCGYQTNSKSKRWRLSASLARKNYFLKNYKTGTVRMIGGNFPIAFSKVRFALANNVCKILWHPVT